MSLLSHRLCGGWRTACTGSFRLLNCIYLKWMLERQNDSGDKFSAVEEETPFTPHVSFLSREDCIAYTLPFQQIELDPLNSLQRSVPLLNDDGQILATLHTIALFIPYALRKPYGVRPPLMHMAAMQGDLPLLQRAVDVENRGELWNFKVAMLSILHPSHSTPSQSH